jgi:hypothetical protein
MVESKLAVGWQACPICQGAGTFTAWRDSSSVLAMQTCPT